MHFHVCPSLVQKIFNQQIFNPISFFISENESNYLFSKQISEENPLPKAKKKKAFVHRSYVFLSKLYKLMKKQNLMNFSIPKFSKSYIYVYGSLFFDLPPI